MTEKYERIGLLWRDGQRSSYCYSLWLVEFEVKDLDATMVDQPYINHIPTMTGGFGSKDVHRFYKDYFIPSNPCSMKMQLISKPIGTDRVVDEIYATFQHTQEIPWMLPDVKPTDKRVEIVLVVICSYRGKKL